MRAIEWVAWFLLLLAFVIVTVLAIVSAGPAFGWTIPCPVGTWQHGNKSSGGQVAPVCDPLPSTTSTTVKTSTTLPPVVIPTTSTTTTLVDGIFPMPIVVMPSSGQPNGQFAAGNRNLEGPKAVITQGDNEGVADLVTHVLSLAQHDGTFSSARISKPYGELGTFLLASNGDAGTFVQYGPPVLFPPTAAPVVTPVQDPAGKWLAGWRWGFAVAYRNTESGGVTSPSPTTCAVCPPPGPCRFDVTYPGPWNNPWWGAGRTVVQVYVGTCADAQGDVFYQWDLDRLWSPTDVLRVLDSNGELPTRVDLNVSGYHEADLRDPIASFAPIWSAGAGVCIRDSALASPTPLLPPVRYEVTGVHCDAACRACGTARGLCSAFASAPPAWRLDYSDTCDANGVRVRRAAQTGVALSLWSPVGKCSLVTGTFGDPANPGYRPKWAVCDGRPVSLP